MHRVKRAIIMAAGMGQRLYPLTLDTPKPLIRVNGTTIIDTVIQGLHANKITEIYVVVGHLKERFKSLEKKYPGLRLIYNPFYRTCNNISSLYVARKYIEEAIILDGDQIIYNQDILKPTFEKSCYNAVWTDKPTEEWIMKVENGKVMCCSRTGGEKGWQLFGISRWTNEDGQKLKNHLEIEFEKKHNQQIYWDDVAMFCHSEEYELGIYEMKFGDVVEIDNLNELSELDVYYRKYLRRRDVK